MGVKPCINRKGEDDSATQGTSTLYGGEISINGTDPSTIDIEAGEVVIVDNYTNPKIPIVKRVNWKKQEGVSLTYLAVAAFTFISIGSGGTYDNPEIFQTTSFLTPEQRRDYAFIGVAIHLNGAIVNDTEGGAVLKKDVGLKFLDFMLSIKILNVTGNNYSALSGLTMQKSSGTAFGDGINTKLNKKNPNLVDNDAEISAVFVPFHINQSPPFIPTTVIDTNYYDPNKDGTLVAIPTGFFTVHRLYFDPITKITGLQYGQFLYDSMKKAALSYDKEEFEVGQQVQEIISRGAVIVKSGATDVTDTNQIRFIRFGFFGDKIFNQIDQFPNFAENIEIADGMSYQRPSITYVNDGGTLYADVEAVGGGDIIYIFNQIEYVLNCTTGSGVSGRARIALTAGSATVPVQNYVTVVVSGDEAVLNASTTFPTGQFGWVCDVLVPDATTFNSLGVYSSQRYSDNKSHDGRGALSYEREKIRSLGTTYESGIVPTITITDLTPDTVDLSTTQGEVYQLHKATIPALDSTTDGIFVINHPTTPWLHVTDIGQVLVDANGDTLNNQSFNFVFVGINSTADGTNYSHLGLLLPSGTYNYLSLSQALADEDNTAITSVPASIKKTAFLIARVTFKYKNGVWNNVTEEETATSFFDLRGTPLGATSGGAGTPSVTTFSDDIFSIYNLTDPTKIVKVSVSGVTTGQTRTLTIPDNNGVITTINNLLGTANQVIVTDGGDIATFSLPQNIHSGAIPNFQNVQLADLNGTDILTYADSIGKLHEAGGFRYLPSTKQILCSATSISSWRPFEFVNNTDNYIKFLYRNSSGATWSYGASLSGQNFSLYDEVNDKIIWQTDENGNFKLAAGSGINEISNDVTFASATNSQISTSLAIKEYIDMVVQGLDWQDSVKDMIDFTTSEPASPSTGDRYINTVTGTSSVTTQSVTANYIYEWNGTSWDETVPNEGYAVWVEDEDIMYVYNGSSWVKFGSTIMHNNTSGLQGGTTSQYYHLTNTQHTDVISLSSSIYTQLSNIGIVIISSAQWVYVGAMDQGVATTDSVEYVQVDSGNVRITGNTISSTNTNGNIITAPNGTGMDVSPAPKLGLGDIKGYLVKYSSSTAVSITAGFVEANGKFYRLSSNTTHTMTSLASGFDFHYIYIDDSASTAPTATIIDSTTEPTWSDSKRGWYNGDDRCIGVVVSPSTGATISYFNVIELGNVVRYQSPFSDYPTMASSMNPDGTWQTPNTNDGDVVTPVTAVELFVNIRGDDATNDFVDVYGTNKEYGDVVTSAVDGYIKGQFRGRANVADWLPLGSSRKIYIGGQDNDDNTLRADANGFGYSR